MTKTNQIDQFMFLNLLILIVGWFDHRLLFSIGRAINYIIILVMIMDFHLFQVFRGSKLVANQLDVVLVRYD